MPLGLMAISAYIKSKGYNVTVFNLNHAPESDFEELLKTKSFDVIGTGGFFFYIEELRHVLIMSKKLAPHAKLVLGGGLASGDPEFVLSELAPDYLVIGEGELAFEMLLETIASGSGLEAVKGIAYFSNGKIVIHPPAPIIKNLDLLPQPDYEGFEFEHYFSHPNRPRNNDELITMMSPEQIAQQKAVFIITGRDCPAKCTFCFRIMGGEFRVRTIDNVMSEIRYLVEKFSVTEINIVDDTFASSQERIFEFCEKIKPFKLSWQCQVRVSTMNETLLRAMKESGCRLISYGFESASKVVLKSMKKGITPDMIRKAIILTRAAKISIQANFIFGDPAETIETAEETLAFYRSMYPLRVGLGQIIPYPGTVLYHHLKRNGKIKDILRFHQMPGENLVNMTKLKDRDWWYIRRRVAQEEIRYTPFARNLKVVSNGKHSFLLSFNCPDCNERHSNVHFNSKGEDRIVVCKNCFQRFVIRGDDWRFGNYLITVINFLRNLYRKRIARYGFTHQLMYRGYYTFKLLLQKSAV